jgi:hypothetical protein
MPTEPERPPVELSLERRSSGAFGTGGGFFGSMWSTLDISGGGGGPAAGPAAPGAPGASIWGVGGIAGLAAMSPAPEQLQGLLSGGGGSGGGAGCLAPPSLVLGGGPQPRLDSFDVAAASTSAGMAEEVLGSSSNLATEEQLHQLAQQVMSSVVE